MPGRPAQTAAVRWGVDSALSSACHRGLRLISLQGNPGELREAEGGAGRYLGGHIPADLASQADSGQRLRWRHLR